MQWHIFCKTFSAFFNEASYYWKFTDDVYAAQYQAYLNNEVKTVSEVNVWKRRIPVVLHIEKSHDFLVMILAWAKS